MHLRLAEMIKMLEGAKWEVYKRLGMKANYVFKPTPEQARRTIWPRCRRGLTRRWAFREESA